MITSNRFRHGIWEPIFWFRQGVGKVGEEEEDLGK